MLATLAFEVAGMRGRYKLSRPFLCSGSVRLSLQRNGTVKPIHLIFKTFNNAAIRQNPTPFRVRPGTLLFPSTQVETG